MYIWVFSRSEGAGRATTRNTRGLTRSVIALIVPPFPAPSRPSNTTMTRSPFCFTHSWSSQSPTWSLSSSLSYSLRPIFVSAGTMEFFCFFIILASNRVVPAIPLRDHYPARSCRIPGTGPAQNSQTRLQPSQGSIQPKVQQVVHLRHQVSQLERRREEGMLIV